MIVHCKDLRNVNATIHLFRLWDHDCSHQVTLPGVLLFHIVEAILRLEMNHNSCPTWPSILYPKGQTVLSGIRKWLSLSQM